MCRCCEARLTPAELAARTGVGWIDLRRRKGLEIGSDLFVFWEAFNEEMLLVVGADLYVDLDPFPPELRFGLSEEEEP